MISTMAERIRIIIDADEEIRLAIKLAATRLDKSVSEVVCTLIKKAFPEEMRDAKRYAPKRGRSNDDG